MRFSFLLAGFAATGLCVPVIRLTNNLKEMTRISEDMYQITQNLESAPKVATNVKAPAPPNLGLPPPLDMLKLEIPKGFQDLITMATDAIEEMANKKLHNFKAWGDALTQIWNGFAEVQRLLIADLIDKAPIIKPIPVNGTSIEDVLKDFSSAFDDLKNGILNMSPESSKPDIQKSGDALGSLLQDAFKAFGGPAAMFP